MRVHCSTFNTALDWPSTLFQWRWNGRAGLKKKTENPVTSLDRPLEWVYSSAGSHYSSGFIALASVAGLECYWNNVNRALIKITRDVLNVF